MVRKIVIILAVATAIIILATTFLYLFKEEKMPDMINIFRQKNKNIIEVKEFSCEGIMGFSFRYPVFKGWEVQGVQKTAENGCTIWLNHPAGLGLEVPPYIAVAKEDSSSKLIELPPDAKINSNGANYAFIYDASLYADGHVPKPGDWDYIRFYEAKFSVKIWAYSVVEEAGFSMNDFIKEVVGSFVFGRSPESVGVKKLAGEDSLSISYLTSGITGRESAIEKEAKEARELVIDELEKDGENPSEFYSRVDVEQKFGQEGAVLAFILWHQDAFKKENWAVQGNPGGKCRTFYYDDNQKKIIRKLFWQ